MLNDLLSLFFPKVCFTCGTPLSKTEEHICLHCLSDLPKTDYHCATVPEENSINRKFYGKVQLRYVLAYLKFFKKGKVQRLLYQFKYGNRPQIGNQLGYYYGMELKAHGYGEHFDLILPVPLHASRLRSRGYNQSDRFAEGLSLALGLPWSSKTLSRRYKSETQTRKSRVQRWQNVAHIFQVLQVEALKDKRILLVDDIITTGATVEACAQVLLEAGVKELSVAAIAEANS